MPTNLRIQGLSSISIPSSSSMPIGAMAGLSYTFMPQLGIRAELEYLYRIPLTKAETTPTETLEIQTHTLLANLYLDYYILPKLNIYAGGGLGLSVLKGTVDNTYIGRFVGEQTNFSAQVGVGVAYTFFNHLILSLNIRYSYLGDWGSDLVVGAKSTFSTVDALVSIAYKF